MISTITHFYTVAHLTAVTALKQMDPEFEAVSASLKQPFYRTFWRVTVPVCLVPILDISIYLFVNAMTTVSAVVFLYGPDTTLASVAVLNMDDAGDIAPAAAMGMMIFYTNVAARLSPHARDPRRARPHPALAAALKAVPAPVGPWRGPAVLGGVRTALDRRARNRRRGSPGWRAMRVS